MTADHLKGLEEFEAELWKWKNMLNDVNTGLPLLNPSIPSSIASLQSESGLIGGKWWRDKRHIASKICGNPPYTVLEICQ